MISTLHLHRRSSRFVAFISILWGSPFETGLRSEIGDFRQIQFSISPYLSTFIIEFTATTTQLIRNISKFDGTDFATCQLTLCAMDNLVHPDIFKIRDCQLRLKPLYRTMRGRSRPAIRGVTTSSPALADVLEG